MKNKNLLILGGAVALTGIGYYLWKSSKPKDTQTSTGNKKNYISSAFFNQPKQRSQDTSF